MTDTQNTQDNVQPEVRELFNVVVAFRADNEGTLAIAATDKDHAVAIVQDLLSNKEQVRVVDVYPQSALVQPAQPAADVAPEVLN